MIVFSCSSLLTFFSSQSAFSASSEAHFLDIHLPHLSQLVSDLSFISLSPQGPSKRGVLKLQIKAKNQSGDEIGRDNFLWLAT